MTTRRFKSNALASMRCEWCLQPFVFEAYRVDRVRFCGFACKQKAAASAASVSRRGSGVGYVKEGGRHQHRVVAEHMLGRSLRPGEVVHHRDRDKQNNSPDNLEILFQPDHVRQHFAEMLARRKEVAGY